MNFRYEWDTLKSIQNETKHGVSFEAARVIWADENALEFLDDDESLNEERFIRIGINPELGVLLVVFCERVDVMGEIIRIISARKATKNEEATYEERIRP